LVREARLEEEDGDGDGKSAVVGQRCRPEELLDQEVLIYNVIRV